MEEIFLASVIKRFHGYKELADKAISRLDDGGLNFIPAPESNSISVIIRHMHGNMVSRWTDFLTTDGEKAFRERDGEFEERVFDKATLLQLWEAGWTCFFSTLQSLQPEDLLKTITIRSEPLTVVDAINRQLAHYPYHVGQIVYIARMIVGESWESLSIPKKK